MKRFLPIFISVLVFISCNGSQENQRKESLQPQEYEEQTFCPQYPETYTEQPVVAPENVQEQPEPVKVEPVSTVYISKEYEEGYDAGYDDGEDDAISRNGYEGQYDDACKYKGQKRKDYQLGYAEGYEAGFYDNVSDSLVELNC